MYRAELATTAPGAVVGATLFNDTWQPLLKIGATLTATQLEYLADLGYRRLILLDEGEAPEPDFVGADARAAVGRALAKTMNFLFDAWLRRGEVPGAERRRIETVIEQALVPFIADISDQAVLTLPGPERQGPRQWFDDALNGAAIAAFLGRAAEMDEVSVLRLAQGMLLRDMGEILVWQELLQGPKPPPQGEPSHLHEHPQIGYDLLRKLDWSTAAVRLIVLEHHERHDGSGYPHGLVGIHSLKRARRHTHTSRMTNPLSDIAAVADVFNSMTTDRPNRPARGNAEVVAELKRLGESKLNREVVELLVDRWGPPGESPREAQPGTQVA